MKKIAVRPIRPEYNIFDVDYEYDLKPWTEISIYDGAVMTINGTDCTIGDALSAAKDTIVSFKGIISTVEPVIEDITETGREVKILKFTVRDCDFNEV